jgi:WD40 repeat protein
MTELLRQKLCDIVTTHGPAVADDPRRCGELLRQAVPEDGAGVTALLGALEARVPARLALLTEPLALAPLTSGLVRRLVEDQGLSEEAARWAVESWAVALGKGDGAAPAFPGQFLDGHVLASPRRRRHLLWLLLPVVVVLAAAGAWWWLGQRAEVRRISSRTEGITCLALVADGRSVLAGCGDLSLRLWDVNTGAQLKRLEGHHGPPLAVAPSPDGRTALSCGGSVQQKDGKIVPVDCVVRTWNLETGEERKPLAEYTVPVWSVAYAPDGRTALACTGWWEYKETEYIIKDRKNVPLDCVVRLYDVATGQELRKLEGHKDPVRCAAFTPDGRRVVSGSFDGTVRLWDAADGRELRRVELTGKPHVICLAVSPDGRRLLTGDEQSRVRLWGLDELEELEVRLRSEPVRALAFSADGRLALSGGDDNAVRLWQAEDLTELRHFPGHSGRVMGVGFTPDGRYAVSGSTDGTVRIWRLPQ